MHISDSSLNPYADVESKYHSLKEQNFKGAIGRFLVYCAACKEFGCEVYHSSPYHRGVVVNTVVLISR